MNEEDDNYEAATQSESQMIAAAYELMGDYGYSREDIEGILEDTVFS